MSLTLITLLLAPLGCHSESPVAQQPQEAAPAAPAPPQRISPRDAPPGVILVASSLIQGTEALPIADGEDVLVLCGDRLWPKPMRWNRDGDGLRPVNPCSGTEAVAWMAGVSMRIGPGSISIGKGPRELAPNTRMPISMGYIDGQLDTSNGQLNWVNEAGDTHRLTDLNPQYSGVLHWVGDLDNDNVPDFIVDTPEPDGRTHLRLFLSAAAPDAQPEEVAAWTAPSIQPSTETP